jgi:peptidoglycan/LPS O-acetylase OafA/YrhL
VSLFFVVSGFLITHILMRAKDQAAAGGQPRIAHFYARRALRLLPALLVTFAICFALDVEGFRSSAPWHVLQASNVYFALHQTAAPWVIGHLWSLNVLEQFYLLWPLVILLLPIQRIYVVVIAAFAVLILVRVEAGHLGIDGWWQFYVLSGDPIFMGAFACLIQRHPLARAVIVSPAVLAGSVVVLALPWLLWEEFGASQTYRFLLQPALAAIVVGAFAGYGGPVGWVLGCGVARYLARISYGVYVYHLLVWWVVVQFWPALFAKGPLPFAVMTALTVGVATVSWYALEEPLNRLKSRFPTVQRR